MELLMIADSTQWFYYSIAFFLLMLGISTCMWAIRTAECYEHDEDPVDHESLTYDEIVMRDHFYGDILNN